VRLVSATLEALMPELEVVYRPISELNPRANNPRTHTKKQIEQIAASIRTFGFTNPVLIDAADGVIAGHGRIEAARMLGMTMVPTIRLAEMSEAQVRAYVIADNRLAELAGWDRELLAIEFAWLGTLDLDFDLSVTGYELPEIDLLIGELDAKPDESASALDQVPHASEGPPVTRPGDVWIIGAHRLICGDALVSDTYARLMAGEKAQMVFTDPPYNVPIAGHVTGLGKVQHREFAMAAGEMSREEFTAFLAAVMRQLAQASQDGAIHFVCMDWRHMAEVLDAGEAIYSELKNLCVWAKTNGGMGSLYRSQHELVFVFKAGTARHINNVELGRFGRYRTNVWSYAGVNSFGAGREDLELHPTVKPVDLVADAIRDCSHRGGIVLDAFGGSGTTLLAAEITGRQGRAIEIDPAYCDVIVRRMAESSQLGAVLEATGQSFEEVAAERLASLALEDGQ
jgi:DNA modification methylase